MADQNETENQEKETASKAPPKIPAEVDAAKKWVSGDKVGAVKDALKLVGRKIKDFFDDPMKAIKRGLIRFGIPTIAALLIPILFFAVILETANAIKEAVVKVAKTFWDWLGGIFTGDGIKVSNKQVDELINSLADQGIHLEDLGLVARDDDMTDEDYDDDDGDGVISESEKATSKARKYIKKFIIASLITQTPRANTGGIEGGIVLKRVRQENGVTIQTIMTYTKNLGNEINAFTVDESNRIVYNARIDENNYTQKTIDVAAYEQYSIPVMFFVDICLSTQCPEYALELAKSIINSSQSLDYEVDLSDGIMNRGNWMTISIMDSYTEVSGTETAYTTLYKDGVQKGTNSTQSNIGSQRYYTTNICVTEVNHLFFHLEQTYEQETSEPTYSERTEEPYKVGDSNTDYSIVTKTISETTTQYGFTTPVQQEAEFYYNEDDSFYKLTKKEYNTSEGIKASAYDLLLDGGDMMFELMDMNLDNELLCQVFKYILFKMSGKSFGVEKLEGNLFDLNSFTTFISSSALLKEYIRYWEASGNAKTNADGTCYIIVNDGAGNAVVGYGVDIVNGGFLQKFQAAGYPTYIGGEVPIEFVDALEENEISEMLQSVKAYTSGLNLTGYQINALVSRAYNMGVSGALEAYYTPIGFNKAYTMYWNQETDDKFESGATVGDYNHALYTNYMSVGTYANGQYLSGLEKRRKSEWTLFQTGYYDVLRKRHTNAFNEGGVTNRAEADALTEEFNKMLNTEVHYEHSKGKSKPLQDGPWPSLWDTGLEPFQCTWWANGRASMYLAEHGTKIKKYPTAMGDGGEYYDINKNGGWFNYGSTPKVNSIISWKDGSYGHVAYVEGVTAEGIWISDCGSGVRWKGVRLISHEEAAISNGYIYLDEPK